MEMSGQLHTPAALPQEIGKLGLAIRKIPSPARNQTPVIQLVGNSQRFWQVVSISVCTY
jgi:hypothetical protein